MSEQKSPKMLVLTGPTASGKTGLAIQWAQCFNGEIINADSRQIYRYMDIGTAKPTPSEQAAVPHHLIDIVNPDQTLTLAEYQQAAYSAVAEIHERGRLPMLVGGTGMYITATLEGWQMPEVPPDPELRPQLEAMSNAQLLEKLKVLDPVTAARIDVHNPRRLVRAVEVCLISGHPFSEQRRKNPPDYDTLKFILTLPREVLYPRADRRIEQMVAAGWLDEARDLLVRGYDPALPSMSALGYPQMFAVLRGEMTMQAAITDIQHATHKFIRRQDTWFRKYEAETSRSIEPDQDVTPAIADWLAAR